MGLHRIQVAVLPATTELGVTPIKHYQFDGYIEVRSERTPLRLRIAPAEPAKHRFGYYCALTASHLYLEEEFIWGETPEEAYAHCAKLITASVGDLKVIDEFGSPSMVWP